MLAFLTPALLFAVAALALIADGVRVISIILLVVGGGLLLVSLFDFPMYTTFDIDGIKRRTPLRTHTIAWDDVTAINRARGGRLSKRAGPLAAAVGGRRYLLVDRVEGMQEYAQLRDLCSEASIAIPVSAVAPDPGIAPTWLYHRKRTPD
jgi:hypothetical protein